MRRLLGWVFAAAVLIVGTVPGFAFDTASICSAVGGNLVANCGFETDSFQNWTLSQVDGDTLVEPAGVLDVNPNSGSFFAALGTATTADTTLSQTITDLAGTTLAFSFYYAYDGSPHSFEAEWDGNVVYSVASASPTAPQGYQQYTFTESATGSDTIAFVYENAIGFDALDDVVVTDPPPSAAPEPSSLGWCASVLLAVALGYHSRRASPTV